MKILVISYKAMNTILSNFMVLYFVILIIMIRINFIIIYIIKIFKFNFKYTNRRKLKIKQNIIISIFNSEFIDLMKSKGISYFHIQTQKQLIMMKQLLEDIIKIKSIMKQYIQKIVIIVKILYTSLEKNKMNKFINIDNKINSK
jgi:hypothetical protein